MDDESLVGRTALTGRALLATPVIGDDRFAHSVILLVEHDATGALGVVLDQATATPLDVVLPDWAGYGTPPAVVFTGGPVANDRALGLVRLRPDATPTGPDHPITAIPRLGGEVGLIDLSADPDGLSAMLGEQPCLRVFAGYAGWSPGQLEAEMDAGAWWTANIGVHDVFDADPATLWQRVVGRQPGERALFARFTGDPAMN
jgi:putative transcriptional regulator